MPEHAFSCSWLVQKLLHKDFQSYLLPFPCPILLHAKNELSRSYIIKIECIIVISHYISTLINHLLPICMQIIQDRIISMNTVGIKQSLEFYAHSIVPTRLRSEVKQIGFRCTFHLRIGHPLRHALIRTVFGCQYQWSVHHDIVKLHVTSFARYPYVFSANTIENTVFQAYIRHIFHTVTPHNQYAVSTLPARNILYIHVSYLWFEATITGFFGFIIKVNLNDCFLTLPHFNASHVDIFNATTATIVRLDTQNTVQMRRIHGAVFGIYVLTSTWNLTPNDDTSMSIFHHTVADNDVSWRLIPHPSIVIPTAFNRYTVISRVEMSVLNQYVLTCFRVTTITIGPFIPNLYTVNGYVLTEQRMNNPEGRMQ